MMQVMVKSDDFYAFISFFFGSGYFIFETCLLLIFYLIIKLKTIKYNTATVHTCLLLALFYDQTVTILIQFILYVLDHWI